MIIKKYDVWKILIFFILSIILSVVNINSASPNAPILNSPLNDSVVNVNFTILNITVSDNEMTYLNVSFYNGDISNSEINPALVSNGGNASASSYYSGYPPSKAIDGNYSVVLDSWFSLNTTMPQWLQVNFSSAKTINQIVIKGDNQFPNDNNKNYSVEVWNGSDWKIMAWSIYSGINQTYSYNFSKMSTSAIRIYIYEGKLNGFAKISELEAYYKPNLIGKVDNALNASSASIIWSNLFNKNNYSWAVKVDNGLNQTTSPVWTFRTDYITFFSNILPLNNNLTNNQTITFMVNITNYAGLSNASIFIYNETDLYNVSFFQGGENNLFINFFASLADGNYTWFCKAYDLYSHYNSTENRSIYIDSTGPAISNFTITPNITIATSQILFNLSAIITDKSGVTEAIAMLKSVINKTNFSMSESFGKYNAWINTTGYDNGNYLIDIFAKDNFGNTRVLEQAGVFILSQENKSEIEQVNFIANTTQSIGTAPNSSSLGTHALLDINPAINVNASKIYITRYEENVGSEVAQNNFLKAIDIVVDKNISDNLNFATIKIYYFDSEIGGIDPSTLRMYMLNESTQVWYLVDNSYVNTAEKYIAANLTHFSMYGIFGMQVSSPANTLVSGGGGGGGCIYKWNCSEWGPCENGFNTRVCTNLGTCSKNYKKPEEIKNCEEEETNYSESESNVVFDMVLENDVVYNELNIKLTLSGFGENTIMANISYFILDSENRIVYSVSEGLIFSKSKSFNKNLKISFPAGKYKLLIKLDSNQFKKEIQNSFLVAKKSSKDFLFLLMIISLIFLSGTLGFFYLWEKESDILIKNKLAFLFISLLIFFLLLAGGFFIIKIHSDMSKYQLQENQFYISQLLKSNQEKITNFIEEKKEIIMNLSKDKEFAEYLENSTFLKDSARIKLSSIIDPEIIEAGLILPNGKVALSTDRQMEGYDFSRSEYFLMALNNTRITLYYNDALEKYLFGISTPIYKSGVPMGIIVLNIVLKSINDLLINESNLRIGEEMYLINRDKFLITESRYVKNSIFAQKVESLASEKCFDETPKFSIAGAKSGYLEPGVSYLNYMGYQVTGDFIYIQEIDSCLIGEVSNEKAYEKLIPLNFLLFLYYLLTFIIMLIAIFIGKRIKRKKKKKSGYKKFLMAIIFIFLLNFHLCMPMDLSTSIPEKYKEVAAGEKFYFQINIQSPETTGRKDLNFEYVIKDSKGNEIASSKEVKAIETQASFVVSIAIPENEKSGYHEVLVKVSDFSGNSRESRSNFFISGKKTDLLQNLLFMIAGGVIVLIAMIAVEFFLLRKRISEKRNG